MNHNRLRCYGVLLNLARRMPSLIRSLPRGNAYLEDQLKRALSSAILNLSEGNSRRSVKERNRFFEISMASISEVSSVIDIIEAYGYLNLKETGIYQSELRASYAMISGLRKN